MIRVCSHYIDGRSHESARAPGLERRNPRTDEVVARFAAGTAADVELAVSSASRALKEPAWRDMSASSRSRLLLSAADAIAANREALANIEASETGKPLTHAREDIERGVDLWRYAAALVLTEKGEAHRALDENGAFAFTLVQPVGVVALITPWNFPFLVAAERLPFLLAAGCTTVWKPSEFTGGSALFTAKLLTDVGFAPGVVNVVTGSGAETGNALVTHQDVAMISFTGSSENGRAVMASASTTFKRLSLELGGKSPILVFADADLEAAVGAVVEGFTHNAGQCCTALTRLLVQRSVADVFEQKLAAALSSRAADFTQPAATEPAKAKLSKYVELGLASAARVLRGSSDHSSRGSNPAVFVSLPKHSAVRDEEIFAPVLTFDSFEDEEEAIRMANDTPFGLAASFWTGDFSRGLRLAQRVNAGRLWINSRQSNYPQLPVGGMGASGFGREAGSSGIRTYSEVKTVITTLAAVPVR